MRNWIEKYKELPWYIRNWYFTIAALFVFWMLFFDTNNQFYQFKLSSKLADLEEQKQYFNKEIEGVIILKEELFSTQAKKEKFAREKYFMKKDNEDVFIVIEE